MDEKPKLTPNLIEIVRSAFKGKKLEKFDASLAVLSESLEQGAWITRGSVKANAGFYQGLVQLAYKPDSYTPAEKEAWELSHCLSFGGKFRGKDAKLALRTLRKGRDRFGEPMKLKVTDDQVYAWVNLCAEKDAAYGYLKAARPVPKKTTIGLSPKVTKTFTEMNLDLDVNSIRMPPLIKKFFWHEEDDGTRKKLFYFVPNWSKGVLFGCSRFSGRGSCEACGKPIPSGRYVPIEAHDKKSGKLIGLWIGCDCARNIFGIQDKGIERNPHKS